MDKRIFMLIKKGNLHTRRDKREGLHTRRDKREGFLFRHSRLARKAAGLYSHGMNRPPGLPCG
ncbi:hypothetical protein, partial [Paenibacillus larvae]|uniref:hypothetical protein n=1 Tax=Paenibacillus larvae TaxID=1464 RepID=UPI00288EC6C5